jgi:hypothetical protein
MIFENFVGLSIFDNFSIFEGFLGAQLITCLTL